jgi:hypothetical protein
MAAVGEADITYLAREWEDLVAIIEYPTRSFIISSLWALAKTYLRGQGIRMGNWQGFKKHSVKTSELAVAVMKRIAKDEGNERHFPTLARLGFGSEESMLEFTRQVRKTMIEREKE